MEWETVFLTFKNKVRAICTNRIDKAKGLNSQRIYDYSSENAATLRYYIIKYYTKTSIVRQCILYLIAVSDSNR